MDHTALSTMLKRPGNVGERGRKAEWGRRQKPGNEKRLGMRSRKSAQEPLCVLKELAYTGGRSAARFDRRVADVGSAAPSSSAGLVGFLVGAFPLLPAFPLLLPLPDFPFSYFPLPCFPPPPGVLELNGGGDVAVAPALASAAPSAVSTVRQPLPGCCLAMWPDAIGTPRYTSTGNVSVDTFRALLAICNDAVLRLTLPPVNETVQVPTIMVRRVEHFPPPRNSDTNTSRAAGGSAASLS